MERLENGIYYIGTFLAVLVFSIKDQLAVGSSLQDKIESCINSPNIVQFFISSQSIIFGSLKVGQFAVCFKNRTLTLRKY